jgi:hypothetical protein
MGVASRWLDMYNKFGGIVNIRTICYLLAVSKKKGVSMLRPVSVYLIGVAAVLLLAGLFLPAGRGLSVMQYHNGEVVNVQALNAEEMGCFTVPAQTDSTGHTGNITQVYFADARSFYSTQEPACGKSPLSMLLTGKYWLANLLLLIPAPLALLAILKIGYQPYAINQDRNWLVLVGIISITALLVWWSMWVKFRVLPGIGFWLSLLGAVLVLAAGLLEQGTDPFRVRHHPHPA